MLNKIVIFFIGKRAKGEYAYKKTSFTTIHPKEVISFEDWCKQLRVSCLHGKKVVYMN